jgi:secondary thiamine-phosphate synthase enzyme
LVRATTKVAPPANLEHRPVDEQISIRRALRRPEGTTTVLAATSDPRIRTEVLHFHTTGGMEFWDLTDLAREVVARSGVRHGQVTVHTPHTTTSVVVNEAETGFFNDFRRLILETVPVERYYEHDDHGLRTENIQEDELLNGHAHCGQMLVGSASVSVPVVDGELLLGTWQRVMFLELDQSRERRVVFHAQGA